MMSPTAASLTVANEYVTGVVASSADTAIVPNIDNSIARLSTTLSNFVFIEIPP